MNWQYSRDAAIGTARLILDRGRSYPRWRDHYSYGVALLLTNISYTMLFLGQIACLVIAMNWRMDLAHWAIVWIVIAIFLSRLSERVNRLRKYWMHR